MLYPKIKQSSLTFMPGGHEKEVHDEKEKEG
jgi:hypothetical protein